MTFDLILHGARFSTARARGHTRSVGVRDGRIAAVGDLAGATAARSLDCTGRIVAPGFIDMHSHSDWVLPQPNHGDVLAPLLEQGITTLVAVTALFAGAVPGGEPQAAAADRPHAARPRPRLRLERHGELPRRARDARAGAQRRAARRARHRALGREGRAPGPASPRETARMADLVRAALDEGAIGLSTGLGYAPGVFADLDELLGVTAPLGERRGVYTSHARSYIALDHRAAPDQPPTNLLALDETAAVWRAHHVKVQHSHLIFVGDRTWPTTDRASSTSTGCARRALTWPATPSRTSAATRRWSCSCRRGR
jgi:N-acyl-D-aspartate/D-glutamate deacylase